MPTSRIMLLSVLLIMLAGSAAFSQQQITQTVTSQNRNCNSVCSVIDIPELNGNLAAVIFITPLSGTYPHPVGAYYMYLNKWSVYGLDGVAIPLGTTFTVEYYVNPDANHFVYLVPQRIRSTDVMYIDHSGLNNSPNAQVQITPHVSQALGYIWDKYDARMTYDSTVSKWFISNINGNIVPSDSAFNVKFSSGPIVTNPNRDGPIIGPPRSPVPTSSACNCVIPTTLPPNGMAGGDLTGNYPDPTVKGLQGRPVSSAPPSVGQTLKWSGSAWEPANDEAGTSGPVAPAAAVQSFFSNVQEDSPFLDNSSSYSFANHVYTVNLTKNSRVVISGNFQMTAKRCVVCSSTKLGLELWVNNAFKAILVEDEIGSNSYMTASVSNFTLDLVPGNYVIAFKATHAWINLNSPGSVRALFSSAFVLPQ